MSFWLSSYKQDVKINRRMMIKLKKKKVENISEKIRKFRNMHSNKNIAYLKQNCGVNIFTLQLLCDRSKISQCYLLL